MPPPLVLSLDDLAYIILLVRSWYEISGDWLSPVQLAEQLHIRH